ncbi:hypothetical protein M9458_029062, partial [Cirrhinus mrigala]
PSAGEPHMGLITSRVPDSLPGCIPADGPKEDFAIYVEWVLVHNDSPFTVCPVEDTARDQPLTISDRCKGGVACAHRRSEE